MIRIAIIEDNKSMRDKLRTAFNTSEKFECDIAASSVEQFLKYQKKLAPADFILLDIELPDGMSGIQGIPYLLKACPTTQIVMLTIHNNYDYVFNAICAGAMGYLMKDLSFWELEYHLLKMKETDGALLSPQIARRILQYFNPKQLIQKDQSKIHLSKKELSVLRFLTDGLTYGEIGKLMDMTVDGVRYYIRNIYKKLQVNSKVEILKKMNSGELNFDDFISN